jgi:hypothetical protein
MTTISCSAKSATSSGTSSQCCGSGSESGSGESEERPADDDNQLFRQVCDQLRYI